MDLQRVAYYDEGMDLLAGRAAIDGILEECESFDEKFDFLLFHAYYEQNLDATRCFFLGGAQPNRRLHGQDETYMMMVCSNKNGVAPVLNYEFFSLGLGRCLKGDLYARDVYGNTLLHLACESGGDPKIVRDLLDHGMSCTTTNAAGQTPLHLAGLHGNTEMIGLVMDEYKVQVSDVMVRSQTLVNMVDEAECTPLMYAATRAQCPDAVASLLHYGADPFITCGCKNVLELIHEKGLWDSLTEIVSNIQRHMALVPRNTDEDSQGSDEDGCDEDGDGCDEDEDGDGDVCDGTEGHVCPICVAVLGRASSTYNYYLSELKRWCQDVWVDSCIFGQIDDVIGWLSELPMGAEVDMWTRRFLGIYRDNGLLVLLASLGHTNKMEVLDRLSTEFNRPLYFEERDCDGHSPFFYACKYENYQMAAFLIKNGVNVDAFGTPPFLEFVGSHRMERGDYTLSELLGANLVPPTPVLGPTGAPVPVDLDVFDTGTLETVKVGDILSGGGDRFVFIAPVGSGRGAALFDLSGGLNIHESLFLDCLRDEGGQYVLTGSGMGKNPVYGSVPRPYCGEVFLKVPLSFGQFHFPSM